MEAYKVEKRKIKWCIHHNKKRVNECVNGNKQLFWKEVRKVNGEKVQICTRIKYGNGRLALR